VDELVIGLLVGLYGFLLKIHGDVSRVSQEVADIKERCVECRK
jgi:hypothetical protein